MENKLVEFLRKKDFKLVKSIGQGGLGKTVLLKDETIDEVFVCKKYSPFYEEHISQYFKNFIDEIKLLYKVYHNNIVRVYNYYLYPDKNTGYILMEYIEGLDIKSFCVENPHLIPDIFKQTISGFCHLESNSILHRDIRPENILISANGTVKIIDLGFGKKIEFEEDYGKSISLNWRYTPPADFENQIYDFKTEVYFVGKLFEEIITELEISNFKYKSILSKMVHIDFENRIESFNKIDRLITSNDHDDVEFSEWQKYAYKSFAECIEKVFSKIAYLSSYENNLIQIERGLQEAYSLSILEDFVQNPVILTRIFVKGKYYFKDKKVFPVQTLRDFLELMRTSSLDKKKIILNNLWQRLDSINRYNEDDDDLPF